MDDARNAKERRGEFSRAVSQCAEKMFKLREETEDGRASSPGRAIGENVVRALADMRNGVTLLAPHQAIIYAIS